MTGAFWILYVLVSYHSATVDAYKERSSAIKCPDGYVNHEQSCYRFHEELFSWPESITFCKALDSNLAKIETISEFNFLKAKAQENDLKGMYPAAGYWIGATDAIVEGVWKWIHPLSPMTRDQVTWMPNEPSNTPTEDCALLWRAAGYLVGDYYCASKVHPLCEIDIPTDPQEVLG